MLGVMRDLTESSLCLMCEVGDWKNHFSEAQSKQMDEEFKKKLSGTRLGAKLKYEQHCQ
ncbi:sulfotransferase 6B1-like [Clarias magur]|uniref:Sulfotransferase n=1 Tax=Clarias magur TaxID=1594786 RepID=A0A8J4TYF1_CLAMG|nr:sulfotransferase 6B1-like [Clarias magur]